MAFIFGMFPLVIAGGAGAASRQSIGTGVLGGMLGATFLAIFFVPLFYVLIRKWSQGRAYSGAVAPPPVEPQLPEGKA
jgi:HAE1 family hydrophobic/amphiphilic exporter-1/multidrug efflux pump